MAQQQLRNSPIGIFDSGLGGLTVMKAVMKVLPKEDIVYFGDTARVPYGTKSPASITKFSVQNARVLLDQGVKAIVVACNSSSSYAMDVLRKNFSVPIIGVIEPGVRKALAMTRNGRLGVVATQATVSSHAYRRQMLQIRKDADVFEQACPLFVPLVEEGWTAKDVTARIAQEYLKGLKTKKIDTLILGCTHYPLLKGVLRRVMGKSVRLVDSACEVAVGLKRLLQEQGLMAQSRRRNPRYDFFVSDEPQHFQKLARRFLGRDIPAVKKLFEA